MLLQYKPVDVPTPNANPKQGLTSRDIDLPIENKFYQLILKLKSLLNGKGLLAEDIDVAQVQQLMNEYTSNPADWEKFALYDDSLPYTRNGIININGNANLLILVWSPKRESAIHDHAKAHCVMKILRGNLTESLYNIPQGYVNEMVQTKATNLEENDVAYISDNIGLHKISNPDDTPSVSLHLYTPPYAANFGCNRYDDHGNKFHVDMSKYYSWQGEVVDGSCLNC